MTLNANINDRVTALHFFGDCEGGVRKLTTVRNRIRKNVDDHNGREVAIQRPSSGILSLFARAMDWTRAKEEIKNRFALFLTGSPSIHRWQSQGQTQRHRDDAGRRVNATLRVVVRQRLLDESRAPAIFGEPDRLDMARDNSGEHLGFGHGIHFCIGARLARMEARVILQELLQQTSTVRLDDNFPVRHVPSIFVRRLGELHLQLCRAEPSVCNQGW